MDENYLHKASAIVTIGTWIAEDMKYATVDKNEDGTYIAFGQVRVGVDQCVEGRGPSPYEALADLARQLRYAYYGEDEYKASIKSTKEMLSDIDSLWFTDPVGSKNPQN